MHILLYLTSQIPITTLLLLLLQEIFHLHLEMILEIPITLFGFQPKLLPTSDFVLELQSSD